MERHIFLFLIIGNIFLIGNFTSAGSIEVHIDPVSGPAPLLVSYSHVGHFDTPGTPFAYLNEVGLFNLNNSDCVLNEGFMYLQEPSFSKEYVLTCPGRYEIFSRVTWGSGERYQCYNWIDVIGILEASYTTGGPSEGTAPFTVTFEDLSTPRGTINSWEWDFGDGQTSDEQYPIHTFANPGNYTVVLTVTDYLGRTDSTSTDFIIGQFEASYSAEPSGGMAPLLVTFTDLSKGTITSWDWDFGDGQTSDEQYPIHRFANPGKYTVILTVTDYLGRTDSTSSDIIVYAPVILVHGWRGSVDAWGALRQSLDQEGISYLVIDYAPGLEDPRSYSPFIRDTIDSYRNQANYQGKFDIVCHSFGSLVSRWYMEQEGGAQNIRLWIGIAPTNHGAAIADVSPGFFHWLNRVFNIHFYGAEPAVKALKTTSDVVSKLEKSYAGRQSDVVYIVIVGVNDVNNPSVSYNPWMLGRTLEKKENGNYRLTYLGDGVVALKQSKLDDNIDCFAGLTHTTVTDDPYVIARVITYLKNPETASWANIPSESLPDQNLLPASGNKGNFVKGYMYSTPLDSTVKETVFLSEWKEGSGATILSPENTIINETNSNGYSLYEYFQYCDVLAPARGVWKTQFDGDTSDFYSTVLVDSPVRLTASTQDPENTFSPGAFAQIIAHVVNSDESGIIANAKNGDTVRSNSTGGVSMVAELQRPDSTNETIILFDDGNHNDSAASDGIFGNRALLAQSGQYDVVIIANSTGTDAFERSALLTLYTEGSPIPTISALSPKKKTVGTTAFTLTINGKNFLPNSTVQWKGTNRTTHYVSSTKLTTRISAKDVKKRGQYPVTVKNPAPGGGISNVVKFKVV